MLILETSGWAVAAERTFADGGCTPEPGQRGIVEAVLDGATLRLVGGVEVRLSSIDMPRGFDAPDAAALLATLALGREVELRYGDLRSDRYGRALAQVHVLGESEIWLQAALLDDGLARVMGSRDDRNCIAALLEHERIGRSAGLGVWAFAPPIYADAPALRAIDGAFTLVEGVIVSIGRRERTVYLNFGTDWSADFTVSFSVADANRFEEAGGSLDALVGQRVRIRGWLTQRDGPWISLDHPEQIEVLDESRVRIQ
jgi:endonuclease YncB( thermonuclease family)